MRRQQELRALAEQALAHALRLPELFVEAQQHVKSQHFTSLNCWDLMDVWSCAQKLVKQQGASILTKDRWPVLLEEEARRLDLGGKDKALLFGDRQFNDGFFRRLMARPAGEFDAVHGRRLLSQLMAQGSLVVPFSRLVEDLKKDLDADPDAFVERASRILQGYRGHSMSSKPLFMT
ncbi:MAG: hypothetical protein JNM56_08845, partial [Planctomycetia bacterium]|nr:hypothetical protein [Planctomycetia bacterium]